LENFVLPVKAFTDRWLKTAGPFDKTREFVDQACPNLWVRIGKRRKSFSVLIGPASHRRRIPIGLYPAMTIAEACRTLLLTRCNCFVNGSNAGRPIF
jgi:hypothetical protein